MAKVLEAAGELRVKRLCIEMQQEVVNTWRAKLKEKDAALEKREAELLRREAKLAKKVAAAKKRRERRRRLDSSGRGRRGHRDGTLASDILYARRVWFSQCLGIRRLGEGLMMTTSYGMAMARIQSQG
jgi:hypothetical protein